jgi:serralysin
MHWSDEAAISEGSVVGTDSSTTPVLDEREPNDSLATAMHIDRGAFAVAANPELWNPRLPSLTLNGAIATLQDQDFFSIRLEQGEQLWINYKPSKSEWAGSTSSITVYDTQGVARTGPNQSFQASVAGTYHIAFHAPKTGGGGPIGPIVMNDPSVSYTAHLSIRPPIDQDIEGLLSGSEWKSSQVGYSFLAESTTTGFQPFTPRERLTAATIFDQASSFTGLTFREAATPAGGDIRFGSHQMTQGGYAGYPNPGGHSDVWINTAYVDTPHGRPGSYLSYVVLHEIGHALGLKHGHEEPALRPQHDGHEYSVMTYRSHPGGPTSNTNGVNQYPQSFMMLDIAALQHMYGASYAANAGDSVYRWDPLSGEMSIDGVGQGAPAANHVFRTIWDGGGTDTYDLSNYGGGVKVDLRPGEWSTLSEAQLASLASSPQQVLARGNVANALLHQGDTRSLIENAIGGAGNDIIVGNQAANRLVGGGGDDRLSGREGNDLLESGAGSDTLDGGAGNDILYFGGALDNSDRADGGEGTDTLVLQGNYALVIGAELLAGIEGISLQSGSIARWGQSGTNSYDYALTLFETNAAPGQQLRVNAQSLLAGEDFALDGSAETDGGRFLVYAGFGTDTLTGGAGNDIFFFEAGRFAAGDRVVGGGGNDALVISGAPAGHGLAAMAIRAGTLSGIESLSFNGRFASDPAARPSYDVAIEDGNLVGGAILIVNASSLEASQSLFFSGWAVGDGRFRIFGGAGGDSLKGGAGDDVIEGGGLGDALWGGYGRDVFVYRNLSDSAGDAPDVIADFHFGNDRIDLSLLDADALQAGDQSFAWIGGEAFTGTAGELRVAFEGDMNMWALLGDVNGDAVADFRLLVSTGAGPPPVADIIL